MALIGWLLAVLFIPLLGFLLTALLLAGCMASFAYKRLDWLIPWYVAITVVARDLVIVSGAVCYRLLIGLPYHP